MMRWPFIRILSLLLILLSAGLIALGWWRGSSNEAAKTPPVAPPRPAEFDLASLSPVQQPQPAFTEILARPVFSATRKPFVPPPPPEPPPPPPPPPVPVPQIVVAPEPPVIVEVSPPPPPEPVPVVAPEPPPLPEPPPPAPVVVVEPLPLQPTPTPPPPPEPPKVEIVEPLLDPGILQLKGTMSLKGTAQALIVAPDAPQGRWVKTGETISGWTLHKVGRYHAEFKAKKQRVKVELYVGSDPKQVGVTQPGG